MIRGSKSHTKKLLNGADKKIKLNPPRKKKKKKNLKLLLNIRIN